MNIKEAVESFINFRRSIGRKDESKTYTLRLFANFMGCLLYTSISLVRPLTFSPTYPAYYGLSHKPYR